MALRTRLLINMANTCMALTTKREIAVVMINQMTTKLGGKMEDGQSQYGHLIPALGWSSEQIS